MQTEDRFLIARNDWSAKIILGKINRGQLSADKTLFHNTKDAYRRISHMRPAEQAYYSVFKIHYSPREGKTS